MAEALLRDRVARLGLTHRIEAHSAGVRAQAGAPVNPAALQVLAAQGIHHQGQARRLSQSALRACDLIVPMDHATQVDIQQFEEPVDAPVRLLMEYAPQAGVDDVFDPFGTTRYAEAFRLIEQGVTGLLEAIRKEQGI